MKYEYQLIPIDDDYDEYGNGLGIQEKLNELSENGWEVISCTPRYSYDWDKNPSYYELFVKRRKRFSFFKFLS